MRNDQRHHAEEVLAGHKDAIATQPLSSKVDQPQSIKDDFDMFADEAGDDMFAEQPSKNRAETEDASQIKHKELDMSMLDDTNDVEGYYRIVLGELLDGRYHVQTNLGKGMFSGVVRASDSRSRKLVAIKIIRKNETMYV